MFTNAAALMASRLVVAILGWAGTILIVRSLSPEEWGAFAFVFNLLGLLSFLTDLGAGRVVLRYLNTADESDRSEYAGSYVLLRVFLGVVAYIVAILIVVLGRQPEIVVEATIIAGLVSIFASFSSSLDVLFQASMRLTIVAASYVLGQCVQVAVTILVFLVHPTLLAFVIPAILYDVVSAVYKLRKVKKIQPLKYRVDLSTWRAILWQAAPLTVVGLLTQLTSRVDVFVLAALDSLTAVGQYTIALKFTTIAAFIPLAVAAPLLSVLVRSWPHDMPRFSETLRSALLVLAGIAGFLVVGFVPIARDLIVLFFGQDFADVSLAAQISMIAVAISFLGYPATTVLVAVERYRTYFAIESLALMTAISANLILVPRFSFTGSSVATLIQVSLSLCVAFCLTRAWRYLGHIHPGKLFRIMLAAALATILGLLLNGPLPWILAGAGAVACYGVLLVLLRTGLSLRMIQTRLRPARK